MSYAVKEIFYTLQGEGANIGRSAVFIRFAGCNLWSGREQDRAKAICQFCDTDFIGGGRWEGVALADHAASLWPASSWPGESPSRFAVLTGGEPLLQVDTLLIAALKQRGFEIAVETNGTLAPPVGIDWICVSPKAGTTLAVLKADEIKLVFPQRALMPDNLPPMQAPRRWLSPMAGPDIEKNTQEAAAYCLMHPEWRLAIQAHKFWNIP
jgi:7-carboxy-7-deazaguanine synthase